MAVDKEIDEVCEEMKGAPVDIMSFDNFHRRVEDTVSAINASVRNTTETAGKILERVDTSITTIFKVGKKEEWENDMWYRQYVDLREVVDLYIDDIVPHRDVLAIILQIENEKAIGIISNAKKLSLEAELARARTDDFKVKEEFHEKMVKDLMSHEKEMRQLSRTADIGFLRVVLTEVLPKTQQGDKPLTGDEVGKIFDRKVRELDSVFGKGASPSDEVIRGSEKQTTPPKTELNRVVVFRVDWAFLEGIQNIDKITPTQKAEMRKTIEKSIAAREDKLKYMDLVIRDAAGASKHLFKTTEYQQIIIDVMADIRNQYTDFGQGGKGF